MPFTPPKSYSDLVSQDKVSKASSKMAVQKCITSEGETYESKAKNIEKYWTGRKVLKYYFILARLSLPTCCVLICLYLSICYLSIFYQSA